MTQKTQTHSPHRTVARVYGFFFLAAFASYGTGSTIVAKLANSPEGLSAIAVDGTLFVIGIILMAIVHTVVNIGMAVVVSTVLVKFNKIVTVGYLGAVLAATVIVMVGAMFMLMLLPLAQEFMVDGAEDAVLKSLAKLLKKGGFYGYQIGMTLWSLGGLLLCYILFVSRLVPRFLPIWGIAGYVIFLIGTLAELFGYGIGVMLSASGGLFEMTLSFWLIFKGFNAPKTEEKA